MKDPFDPGTDELVLREQSVQSKYLDEKGREIPNATPMEPPVGYVKRKTIAEQMREMIAAASAEAAQAGAETEEEANDFDVDEDFDPTSPWEHDFDVDPAMEVMLARASSPPVPQGQEAKPPVPEAKGDASLESVVPPPGSK